MKPIYVCAGAALLLVACGRGTITVTEYAGEIETVVHEMAERFETIDADWEAQTPTLDGALGYWQDRLEIRHWFLDEIRDVNPPEGIAAMHEDSLDVFTRITEADEALAARVATLDEISEHRQWLELPEGQASLAVLEEVYEFCRTSQSEFDATEDRAALEGVPWVPPQMKEIVKVAFGCPPQDGTE